MRKIIKKIKIEKILEYLLYLVAFLLTLQTRYFLRMGEINGDVSEYATIGLYGIDLLIIIVILLNYYIVIKSIVKSQLSKVNIIWYFIAGLELFIFISIFFADDKILAIYRYGVFLLGIGLFWVLTSATFDKIKLLYFFIAGMALQAGLGIWQFLTQSSFANKWLGLAMHNSSELGVSVIEAIGSDEVLERWLRAYGGVDHPNILGGVLAVSLLLILSLYLNIFSKKSQIPRPPRYARHCGQANPKSQIISNIKYLISKKIINYLLLTSYFLLLTSLLFTFSRGAWLGFVVSLIVLLIGLVIKKDLYKQRELLIIILISAILFSLIYSQYTNLFQIRVSLGSRLENISYVERVSSINDAKKIIRENFWFGAGMGNYTLELAKNICNKPSWFYQPVHNMFLLILSEIGIFGFLFWLVLIIYLFIKFFRSQNYLALSIIIFLIIVMMFDHWLWSLHFGVIFWWMVLGICLNFRSLQTDSKQELEASEESFGTMEPLEKEE